MRRGCGALAQECEAVAEKCEWGLDASGCEGFKRLAGCFFLRVNEPYTFKFIAIRGCPCV